MITGKGARPLDFRIVGLAGEIPLPEIAIAGDEHAATGIGLRRGKWVVATAEHAGESFLARQQGRQGLIGVVLLTAQGKDRNLRRGTVSLGATDVGDVVSFLINGDVFHVLVALFPLPQRSQRVDQHRSLGCDRDGINRCFGKGFSQTNSFRLMRNRIDDNQLTELFDGDQENFVALIGEDGLPAEHMACLEQNQADHDAF